MSLRLSLVLGCCLLIAAAASRAQVRATPGVPQADTGSSATRLHLDLPYCGENHKILTDLYTELPQERQLRVSYVLYKYDAKGDSTLIIRTQTDSQSFKKGITRHSILLSALDKYTYNQPVFISLLRKADIVAPGSYKVYLSLLSGNKPIFHQTFTETVDSGLSATSSLRKDLSQALVPASKTTVLGVNISSETTVLSKTLDKPAQAVKSATGRIDRLFKTRGFDHTVSTTNGKQVISLYYQGWFAGRYELNAGQSLTGQLSNQKSQLTGNVSSLATNELESYKSLFSQVRELNKKKKEDNELKGELAVSGTWSNGQPEYSQQDNNYYEVRGHVETKVADIPVSIEGYYTTQDAHRIIRSSYIRFHYDAEKAKEELLDMVTGYKSKYSQTVSKGKGLEMIYGSYLNQLKAEENKELTDLKKETGATGLDANSLNTGQLKTQITATVEKQLSDSAKAQVRKDTAALRNKVSGQADSSSTLKAAATRQKAVTDSADRMYRKAMKRYEQIQKLEKQAQKYYALLAQYRNTVHFDSAMAYSKVQGLEHGDTKSYKELAKDASGLLPEGKVKKFVTGLTSLDAGIFSQYTSKYTMAGQQLKGLSVGYDLGIVQAGAALGSTGYAGRDGSLDKYTTYLGSLTFTKIKHQKIGLVYYGYTPGRSALNNNSDTFFKNTDLQTPTFQNPVHIISATYEGTVAKGIRIEGEAATSYQNGQSFTSGFDASRLAWQLSGEGMIPKTGIDVVTGYQHGGRDFQNSTLPVTLAGTDLYKAGAKGDFLRSFLTLGLEFNHMEQSSFATKGGNNRWGFEISTHSKQYPSVSLSYKPFTTFRSYADTFSIGQHPLVGAVWTGRASWQIKKKGGKSWRFNLVYNRSDSHTDTVSYGSSLVQGSVIYSDKQWMVNGAVGSTMIAGSGLDSLGPVHQDVRFVMASVSRTLGKGTSVSGGADIGYAPFGLSKYGVNAAVAYRLAKLPLSLRLNTRYSSYKLTEELAWQKLVSGGLDIIWQFRTKLNR